MRRDLTKASIFPILGSAIPDVIWRYISTFLDDDSRFKVRVLNTAFYEAYYATHTHYEGRNQIRTKRALKLTMMGRVFPNVHHLNLEDGDLETEPVDPAIAKTCPDCGLEECGFTDIAKPHTGQKKGFPRLESLFSSGTRLLPAFAGPTLGPHKSIIRLALTWAPDVKYATPKHFPNLRFMQAPFLALIDPHPCLEEIRGEGLDDTCLPEVTGGDLAKITRENYPKLIRIVSAVNGREEAQAYGFYDQEEKIAHFLRLQREGIAIVREEDAIVSGWTRYKTKFEDSTDPESNQVAEDTLTIDEAEEL